jgi:hypothetical protein
MREFMKTISILSGLTAGMLLLVGCSSPRTALVLDPVGPAPVQTSPQRAGNGVLVVFSAYEAGPNFANRDPYRPACSDYKILSETGALLRAVHNDSGTILQQPAAVPLPAGQYQVLARANGYGTVTVPVVIEAQRSTVLHLEGGSWPRRASLNRTNFVRLPDGQVIGWRSGS